MRRDDDQALHFKDIIYTMERFVIINWFEIGFWKELFSVKQYKCRLLLKSHLISVKQTEMSGSC